MNKPWIVGQWNQFKGKVKDRWGKLTDDDLDRAEGQRDVLLGRIQERYGKSRSEAENDLSQWEESMGLTAS